MEYWGGGSVGKVVVTQTLGSEFMVILGILAIHLQPL